MLVLQVQPSARNADVRDPFYNGPSYTKMKTPNYHDSIREARRELWLFAINVALVTTALVCGLIWITYTLL